jgi:hypothetical protein
MPSLISALSKGIPDTSTLTYHLEDSLHSSERQSTIRTGTAKLHLATEFCLGALAMLSAGGLLAGLVVLRIAIYFSCFHY